MRRKVLALWPGDSGLRGCSVVCCIKDSWLEGALYTVWICGRIQAAWNIVIIKEMIPEQAIPGVYDLEDCED